MALYHFSVTQIKRSQGSSAIASAAYRAGEKLHSERYDEVNDYTRKGGVVSAGIVLPPHAPPDYADRETLWNAIEAAEKRGDAQLAYSFDIAFQNEFTLEENAELARRFIAENFSSRGMIVDYAIHDPDREPGGIPNPHFHVMIPIRPLNPDGTWGDKQKKVPVLDEEGNQVWDEKYNRWKFKAVPTTDWGSPETLEQWRQNWCDLCNAKFAEKSLDIRIDNRSYERQGVDLIAQVHEGPAVRAMEKRGIPTEKGEYNRWVKATNAAIKALGEKIKELLNWIRDMKEELSTPKPITIQELLLQYLDIQKAGAQGFSRYGRQKAGITNLKDVSEIRIYLDQHGIYYPDQLEARLSSLTDTMRGLNDSMKAKSARMKELKEALGQVKVYQENLPVFTELGTKKFKHTIAIFKEQHDGELRLFYRARRVLKEAGMPDHYDPSVKKAWERELSQLEAEYQSELARFKPIRDEQMKVAHIRYCVDRVLQTRSQPEREEPRRSQGQEL